MYGDFIYVVFKDDEKKEGQNWSMSLMKILRITRIIKVVYKLD